MEEILAFSWLGFRLLDGRERRGMEIHRITATALHANPLTEFLLLLLVLQHLHLSIPFF